MSLKDMFSRKEKVPDPLKGKKDYFNEMQKLDDNQLVQAYHHHACNIDEPQRQAILSGLLEKVNRGEAKVNLIETLDHIAMSCGTNEKPCFRDEYEIALNDSSTLFFLYKGIISGCKTPASVFYLKSALQSGFVIKDKEPKKEWGGKHMSRTVLVEDRPKLVHGLEIQLSYKQEIPYKEMAWKKIKEIKEIYGLMVEGIEEAANIYQKNKANPTGERIIEDDGVVPEGLAVTKCRKMNELGTPETKKKSPGFTLLDKSKTIDLSK